MAWPIYVNINFYSFKSRRVNRDYQLQCTWMVKIMLLSWCMSGLLDWEYGDACRTLELKSIKKFTNNMVSNHGLWYSFFFQNYFNLNISRQK